VIAGSEPRTSLDVLHTPGVQFLDPTQPHFTMSGEIGQFTEGEHGPSLLASSLPASLGRGKDELILVHGI
jgi:hypothetical protein